MKGQKTDGGVDPKDPLTVEGAPGKATKPPEGKPASSSKKWVILAVFIAVLITGIFFAARFMSAMLTKSKQSEAKTNLGAIYIGEQSYLSEHKTYGQTFDQISWAVEGGNRYAYYLPGQSLEAREGGTKPRHCRPE